MVSSYFEAVYNDAVRADAEVFMAAMERFQWGEQVRKKRMDPTRSGAFWVAVPFDRIVEMSRGLADLDDEFHHKLQTLLVQGRIHVRMHDIATGKPVVIRSPDVFTFEDEPMDLDLFYRFMLEYPPTAKISTQEG